MCGRYSITTPAEAMQRVFRFAGPLPNLPPRYSVAPGRDVTIVQRSSTATVAAGSGRFWA